MEKNLVIGIDIGGTYIRVALVEGKGNIIRKVKKSSSGDIINNLIESIKEVLETEVKGIGIGVAGVIDKQQKVVKKSPNLPTIENINFIKKIEDRFSLPVYLENDTNAAAIGERWLGAGRDKENFVLLTLGTGIGGGVVYKGKLLDLASELGHITVEAEGLYCPCGNNGCLESYASARAIVSMVINALEKGKESIMRQCYEGNFYRLTSEDIYKYALEGDSLARESLKKAGKYLGIGIATFINIFSPDAVIIGGGLIGAWDILIQEAKKEAERRAFPQLIKKAEIIASGLGDNAGILGAAYLILEYIKKRSN